MTLRALSGLITVLALFVLAGLAFTQPSKNDFALAEFSVRNLSCGSCVGNIRKTLAGVDGIGAVEVSVSSGRARVEFDPERIEAGAIADMIAAAGYPAAAEQILTAEEYRALTEDQDRLATRFVGRIGERLISRDDFAAALSRREDAGAAANGGLLKGVWQEIVQRQILLAAAEANGVVVQDGEIEIELARRGATAAHHQRFKEEMTIGRNLELHVLSGESDPTRRRVLLDEWYREQSAATPVTIFDPALKGAVEGGGSGCGGSCCG